MDDITHGQFLVIVGDVCLNARLAKLPVEVTTRDGQRVSGVPQPQVAPATGEGEVDSTGFARDLTIGDEHVALDSIVDLRIRIPALS